MNKWDEVWKKYNLPKLPTDESIEDMRWIARTNDWWAKTETSWWWLRGDELKKWIPSKNSPD